MSKGVIGFRVFIIANRDRQKTMVLGTQIENTATMFHLLQIINKMIYHVNLTELIGKI